MSKNKINRDLIADAVFSLLEDRHIKTFAELKMTGKVKPEIEEDFRRYCEVAREVFEKVGKNFSLNM